MQHEPGNPTEPDPAEPAQPDPPQDQDLALRLSRINFVRGVVHRLLDFGRHLASTVRQRVEAPNFPALAVNFGTARVPTISAYLLRGILRAIALQKVLRARFGDDADLDRFDPTRPPCARPAPADPTPGPAPDPSADPSPDPSPRAHAAARGPYCRPARPIGWDDPERYMPTMKELEAQVRRQPIGRTLAAICLDLGITPGFCTPRMWDQLLECIYFFGGNLNKLMLHRDRRRQAFQTERDRRPTPDPSPDFRWWDLGKNGERQILGFLFGETPVNPFTPPSPAVAPIATGPP